MAENSNTSQNLKEVNYYVSNPLTPQEIESLRKDMEEADRRYDELSELEFQKSLADKEKSDVRTDARKEEAAAAGKKK